jgi:hypothetical protein
MWKKSCSSRLITLWIGIVLAKVMFIKIHGTVDWSSIVAELSLSQRVAKTAEGGWGCLFIGMHLALNRWFGRKQSMQILVGHGGAAGPRLQTPSAGVAMHCHREFQKLQGMGLCTRLQTPGAGVACPKC